MVKRKIQIDKERLAHQKCYLFIKRLFDIVASCLGLIVLSPIFLITAICIKVNDPKGPVFYTQTGVGKNGKQFRMFKFRSMVSNASNFSSYFIYRHQFSVRKKWDGFGNTTG